MKKRFKQFHTTIKGVDAENRTLTAIASTSGIDRHGDRIMQDGWDLEEFKKTPVIIANHDYKAEKVVGKAIRIEVIDGNLEMEVQFSEDTQLAKDIFNLFKNGFLNAFSVGFIPLEASWETETDSEGNKDSVYIIKTARLLEVSAVAIPANPQALVKAVKQGVVKEESCEYIRDVLGKEYEVTEKVAELDKMLKIFASNNEITKKYRTLLDHMCKRCGIEPMEDEALRVDKLLSTLKLLLPQDTAPTPSSVETQPTIPTKATPSKVKQVTGKALKELIN